MQVHVSLNCQGGHLVKDIDTGASPVPTPPNKRIELSPRLYHIISAEYHVDVSKTYAS